MDAFQQVVEIIKQVARETGEHPDEFARRAAAQARTEMTDETMRATFEAKA